MSDYTADLELTYDGLDLLGGSDSPYRALADGTSFGSAERAIESFARLLFNGEDMRLRRRGNRSLSFNVEVVGDDPLALAEAGARLELAADKPMTTLRWKPPGLNTPVSVFRTFPALEIEEVFDDLDAMRGRRVYRLAIPASPFAYSESPVTVDVPAGGTPSLTLVDDMSSATGWSGHNGVTVSSSGGILTATQSVPFSTSLQFDGPSRTVSDYVAVDLYVPYGPAVTLVAGSLSYPMIGAEQLPTNGWQRMWFRPGAGTKTLGILASASSNMPYARVDAINTTSTPPKGLPRMVPVEGSAPSEVAVRVTLGGSTVCVIAGGPRLAYYKPLMGDGTISGTSPQFGGPGGGAYALVFNNTATASATAYTVTGSDSQAVTSQFSANSVASLGTFFVPPGRGGAPLPYSVTFGSSISGTVWALPVDDDHSFAIFTGLSKAYLFLEPPTLENPQGGAWEGNSADGSDATPVLSKASRFQLPQLAPAQTPLYVYPETAALQLTYTPAWGGNAAL